MLSHSSVDIKTKILMAHELHNTESHNNHIYRWNAINVSEKGGIIIYFDDVYVVLWMLPFLNPAMDYFIGQSESELQCMRNETFVGDARGAQRSGLCVLADWSMWWLSRGGPRQLARLLFCDRGVWHMMQQKKKTTWLVAPVTAVFAPSTDLFVKYIFSAKLQWCSTAWNSYHVLMQEVMPCCAILWSNLCYWCFFEQPNETTERFGVYNRRLLRTSRDKSLRRGWFYEGSNRQESNYFENNEKKILIPKKNLGIGFILSLSLLIHLSFQWHNYIMSVILDGLT